MARTFRLRHLPSLPGTARRFAFTHSDARLERDRVIVAQARRLAPEIIITTYNDRIAHVQDGDARGVVDALEAQVVVPLLSPHDHPWRRRWGINMRCARYYRRLAHRAIRHRVKQLLNHSMVDLDELLMPAWYEHWDRWDMT